MAVDLRRRLPRAEREEQLLAVALELFAERGFRDPSMEEIAVRAGVTKPVLYDHFGSRDGLVAACIRHAGDQLLRDVDAAAGPVPGAEQALHAGVAAFFTFVETQGQGWFMLVGENSMAGPAAEAVEAVRRQQADYVSVRLQAVFAGVEPMRLDAFAQAIIGACERVALWRRERPAVTADEAAATVMALIWSGLRSLEQPER